MNSNKIAISLLKTATSLFESEYWYLTEIDSLFDETVPFFDVESMEAYQEVCDSFAPNLNAKQAKTRDQLVDFFTETTSLRSKEIEIINFYYKECEKLINKIKKEKETITYQRYLRIEKHIRIALASIGLHIPEKHYSIMQKAFKGESLL